MPRKLDVGDRRSIGRADEVVAEVLADSSLFEIILDGMFSDDPIVRLRSTDAIEEISEVSLSLTPRGSPKV